MHECNVHVYLMRYLDLTKVCTRGYVYVCMHSCKSVRVYFTRYFDLAKALPAGLFVCMQASLYVICHVYVRGIVGIRKSCGTVLRYCWDPKVVSYGFTVLSGSESRVVRFYGISGSVEALP